MTEAEPQPIGYSWRSSKQFIVFTVTLALFAETFLYGFLVPILAYMLEVRLRIDPSQTQHYTTTLLSIHGLLSVVSAPIIAHFADKTPNRKIPLVISLGGCLVGTFLVALTPSLWALFLGRYMQAVCGSATWIVSFAILLDCIPAEKMGTMTGIVFTFITGGVVGGPSIAGVLLELVGYWATWSVPMVILLIDIAARFLMIESRDLPTKQEDEAIPDENTALLADDSARPIKPDETPAQDTPSGGFYRIMLSDKRVLVGLANTILMSSIISGFDNVLPLHLRDVFGWGSMATGLIFFCFQVPSFFLSALSGALRDKCGIRIPTTIGWALMAPLMWLLGVPGDERFPWAGPENGGKTILVATFIVFGTSAMLVRGAGGLQVNLVVKDMQAKNPFVFGPHGGNAQVQSMLEMSFSSGLLFGPMLTGALLRTVGYYYMTFTIAVICLLLSIASYFCFDGKRIKRETSTAA